MIKFKVFRANRGEGKTKWLVNSAIELSKEDCDIYYVGDPKKMIHFEAMWMMETGTVCPVKHITELYIVPQERLCYFITDDFVENIDFVVSRWNEMKTRDAVWYITMGKEDFVN